MITTNNTLLTNNFLKLEKGKEYTIRFLHGEISTETLKHINYLCENNNKIRLKEENKKC